MRKYTHISTVMSAPSMPTRSGDVGLMITRLFFGLSMAWAHGLHKLPPSEKWIAKVESLGFMLPELFAWSAGLAECAGGLLIALGLATRGAALSLLVTMGVAVFIAHGGDPFRKMELGLCYGVVSLMLTMIGPGRYSLDHLFSARRDQ